MDLFFRGFILGISIAAPVGPIGLLCIRRSLVSGWRVGFFAGMGAAVADSVSALVAVCGLSIVASFINAALPAARVIGGCFLIYIGVRIVWPVGMKALKRVDGASEMTTTAVSAAPVWVNVSHATGVQATELHANEAHGTAVRAAMATAVQATDLSAEPSAKGNGISAGGQHPTAWAACGETFFLTLTNPLTILSFTSALAAFDASGWNWRALNMVSGVFSGSAAWWLMLSFSASRFQRTISPGFMAGINYVSAAIICGFGFWCLAKH